MNATTSRDKRKTARRLLAADGYLDLMMPKSALKELDRIEDPGDFEASVFYLRGVSLQALGEIESAIPWLEEAARLIPAPLCQFAWKSLGECYTARGEETLAEMARLMANSAKLLGETFDSLETDDLIIEPPSSRPHGPAK